SVVRSWVDGIAGPAPHVPVPQDHCLPSSPGGLGSSHYGRQTKGAPMPGRHAETLIDQLAVSVAEGRSVVTWCQKHGVATRTAYHWYKAERFQRLVAEYRRRAVDRAIGKMGRKLGKAVGKIVRLVEKGQDGKVKLAAAKTLIDRLLEVQSRA